jgi:hypothetical protein
MNPHILGKFIVNQMKVRDMRYLLVILLMMTTILIAGCVSESRETVTPVIPATVITTLAIPTTSAQKMVEIPTIIIPTKTPTLTKAPSKPIESPVMVNGTPGKIMRFSTVAPGIVKFTIKYGGGTFEKSREGCAMDDRATLRLVGASIDTPLYSGVTTSEYSGTTTYNLVSPGNYSLTARGCYNWRVDIDNA